ncbi:UNVERIFIED_CONTAM: hypothetical protein FKN15_042658 [Acipenser sinensis]
MCTCCNNGCESCGVEHKAFMLTVISQYSIIPFFSKYSGVFSVMFVSSCAFLSLELRRNRVDDALKQNLRTGLTQALQNAFKNRAVYAQIESLTGTTNVTVGYYATNGRIVYISAVVIKALTDYGDLMSDIKQHVTNVQSLPIPVAPWIPTPALWVQLKTVLRFVGATDNIQSCNFVQTMEQRLQNAFTEAESKVLNAKNNLTVQILNTSQSVDSPAVTLIYVVWNQSVMLNGTVSSSLLNQLTAELVGYYLFFPPLIIAEPLKYNNLDTSPSTKDYWVTTDVDNSSLNGNYQSFASLMEQRLAELLVIAQRQGRRFRRATTVGSYTVQMVEMKRVEGAKNPVALTYYVLQNGTPLLGTTTAKILNTIDSQTMALTLGYFVQLQAEPVVKNPPNNLWIIAAVLAPIAVVTVIIIIITAVLCRKNKNDFKSDTMANMHQRAKIEAICNRSYLLQPVQGFDYAKQHLGQQGGEEEETSPVTQEMGVLPLPVRDAPLSQERGISQDGSTTKTTMTSEICKRSSPDPYDTSSGSLQLIAIKPLAAPPSNSHPDRSQDSAVINGEVNKALKQKSDIEHYRNKVRLKAKRKGYYDFPALDGNSKSLPQKQRHMYEKAQMELDKVLDPDEDMSSTYVKSKNRSTSDIGTKTRTSEPIGPEHQSQHDAAPFVTRAASVDQPVSNYSGNPAPAVYAIPANRPGYSGYCIPTPPTPYRSQTWMPYPAEGNVPSQWAEAVPLPGYVEAYPHSRYQQNSPPRLPRQYNQVSSLHPTLDQTPTPSTTASQQSLTENDTSDTLLTNISTAALVKAIREEVAKLAKKQTDMFEFQERPGTCSVRSELKRHMKDVEKGESENISLPRLLPSPPRITDVLSLSHSAAASSHSCRPSQDSSEKKVNLQTAVSTKKMNNRKGSVAKKVGGIHQVAPVYGMSQAVDNEMKDIQEFKTVTTMKKWKYR